MPEKYWVIINVAVASEQFNYLPTKDKPKLLHEDYEEAAVELLRKQKNNPDATYILFEGTEYARRSDSPSYLGSDVYFVEPIE